MESKKVIWLFFLAITLFYLSLSPGMVSGMGYMTENLNATTQIVSNILEWLSLQPATTPIDWPRHGFLELVFEVPFGLFSHLLFGSASEWTDRMLSIQPILSTSLLCTLMFFWVRRITSSSVWGYALALIAAFSTMLWPYAYIGLETTQSLFLLLSAYLALGSEKRTWPRTLLFGAACSVAFAVKLNGITLLPAVGFLILCYFHNKGTGYIESLLLHWKKALVVASTIAVVYVLNAYVQTLYFVRVGFTDSPFAHYFTDLMVKSPVDFALNVFSFFCSPNKGLFLYSPVVIICLIALCKAYRVNPRIVIFTTLALAGVLGAFALTNNWADETWGPRYIHQSVAPLIICFALTRKSIAFRFRREAPLLLLASGGLAISFLGCFFYYGALHIAAIQSEQSTLEGIQSDITYNHIRFNSSLFQIWMRERLVGHNPEPQPWPPPHRWWFEPPPGAPQSKTIDLRDFATPQAAVIHAFYSRGGSSKYMLLFLGYFLSLVFGFALLLWTGRLAARSEALPDQLELPG